MRHILSNFRIARHFFDIVRDTSKTQSVFELVEALARHEGIASRFTDTPSVSTHLDVPFSQGFPEISDLRAMPEDSLGGALARHMDELGVDFSEFDRMPEPKDRVDTISRHVFETHDIWHVLTGFGPGPANELGLQAFMLAQLQSVRPLVLVLMGLVRIMLAGSREVVPVMDALTLGWTRGREAKPLFGIDWRTHLRRPLAEVRAELRIVPIERAQLTEIPEKFAA